MKQIRVEPLAAESLGVRSMCTYVETPDVQILMDAGASLCPYRLRLPPHPQEFNAIQASRTRIVEAAKKAAVVTISHYHFDHNTPSYEDWLCNWTTAGETAKQIYAGKTVFMKNPREQVNYSQRRRGWMFQKTAGKHADKLIMADDKTFVFGETNVKFSPPVFHGSEGTFLGWVLMTTVKFKDEVFMFAPDVQGPMIQRTLQLILDEKPQQLMIGGPPLYLSEDKVSPSQIKSAMDNLEKIAQSVSTVILDHHLLRDENWREKTKSVFDEADSAGCSVLTAAEFLGKENVLLESRRKKLYAESPVSKEFAEWQKRLANTTSPPKPPI